MENKRIETDEHKSKRHLACSLNNINSERTRIINNRKIAYVTHSPPDHLTSHRYPNDINLTTIYNKSSSTNNNKEYESFNKLTTNNGIITASSWRVGEVLAQKQLKQYKSPTMTLSTQERPSRAINQDLEPKPKSTSRSLKRTEHHLINEQQIKKKPDNQLKQEQIKQSKQIQPIKPYDLEDVHKYMLDQKTKRLYESKSEKEKRKRDEEERKRKLDELYKKQRSQQILTKQLFRPTITRQETNKFVYEQDMSKVLQDKITHLLNDNDKLVNKRTKLVNFTEQYDEEESSSSEEEVALKNVTNFNNKTPYLSTTSYEHKHDRLKKICSMALDLQTKLQQTKLKLFGVNSPDEEPFHYNKNEDDSEENSYNIGPITTVLKNQKSYKHLNTYLNKEHTNNNVDIPGVLNMKSFKVHLSPNEAAIKIQKAFRTHLNKKNIKLKRKTNLNDLKQKQKRLVKQKLNEQSHFNKPQADEYNFINIFKKKNDSLRANEADRANSRKLNILPTKKTLNKSTTSNSSTNSSDSTSTSLSKYMIEPEQLLIDNKKDTISSNMSSSSSSTASSLSIKQNEEEESRSSSRSSTTSNTLTNGSSVSSPLPPPPQPPPLVHKRLINNKTAEAPKELRYSPASLECLLKAGINYLDTLNTSAIHLEELDKVRCIGLAQQDTVALAHLIKEQQTKVQVQQTERIIIAKNESMSSSSTYSVDFDSKTTTEPKNKIIKKQSSSNSSSSSYSDTESESTRKEKKTAQENSFINTMSDLNDKKTTMSVDTEVEIEEENDLEESFKQVLPSKSHMDQSINDISQTSFTSQSEIQSNVRISFEDDAFKKFTGEIVKKYMQEEEMRSKHQADLLKLREKALIDKTKAELTWLEQMKKKAQDKGEDEKMPSILKKEKGIMQKLKEEQENIDQMKEVQRIATLKRMKILSKHSDVIKWCQNKLKKSIKIDDSNDEESINNESLVESKIMKQVKQHLNSEKYLTEREKKLRKRRKHAEEIIAWKMKLDDEEKQVREIEKKAKLALNKKHESSTSSQSTTIINNNTNNQSVVTDSRLNNDEMYSSRKIPPEVSYSESFITTEINQQTNKISTTELQHSSIESNHRLKTIQDDISIKTNLDENIETNLDDDDDIYTKSENKMTDLIEQSSSSPSISSMTNTNTAKDLENKVKELKSELTKKKQEAEKLKQSLKSKEKSKLKEKEESLRKKINSYDNLIGKIKTALHNQPEQIKPKEKVPIKEDDSQIRTQLDVTTASIATQLKETKSSTSSITLSSVSTSSSSSSINKSQSRDRVSVVPSHIEDKYEDDFNDSTKSESKKKSFLSKDPEESEHDDNKSTVSEISEDIMIESTTTDNKSITQPNRDDLNKSVESETSSSSSTDTQILLLGRSKTESINTNKEIKSDKIVESIVNDIILSETIDQMISIRETKNKKLAQQEEKEKLKIFIPSINLEEEDNKTKTITLNKSQELKLKLSKLKVPYKKDKIEELANMAIECYYWPRLQSNLELKTIENIETNNQLIDYFKTSMDESNESINAESELTFKKMLIDLIGELMNDLYLDKYQMPKPITSYFPGIKRNLKKQYFKSIIKGPVKMTEAQQLVRNRLNNILKLDETIISDVKQSVIKAKSKWRSQKRLDLVDNLLDYEMREQEFEWSNYDVEEYEAKLLITNTLFDMILKDTVDCFQSNFLKKINI